MFIDTNVIVAARVPEAPQSRIARRAISRALQGPERLRISRQIIREYLATVTRPQAWSTPLDMAKALGDVERMCGVFEILEDGPRVMSTLAELCRDVPLAGKRVHDANIAATMLAYGEQRLLTLNPKDFRRFADRVELVRIEGPDRAGREEG
ncbi:type II toxin-antitoxin system VapC family toxin [Candidatus Palauibacter sp.]|uniref:type II toxin-antitoxin system VapC family toxin n=1 Tax=Candidatus Palauibacter sp. TaxID=3101350 RepID=UPI003AF27E6C